MPFGGRLGGFGSCSEGVELSKQPWQSLKDIVEKRCVVLEATGYIINRYVKQRLKSPIFIAPKNIFFRVFRESTAQNRLSPLRFA